MSDRSWDRVAAMSLARAAAQLAPARPVLACITQASSCPPAEFVAVCAGDAHLVLAGAWCTEVGCGGHLICGPCAQLAGLT